MMRKSLGACGISPPATCLLANAGSRQRDVAIQNYAELGSRLDLGVLLLLVDPRSGTESATNQRTDAGALTASGNGPNYGPCRCTPADEHNVALALACASYRTFVVGVDIIGVEARQ